MPEYRVGTAADIPEGGKLVVACGSAEIGIFRVGGELFAWHNSCGHRQGPVCQGRLFRRVIEPVADDGTVRALAYARRQTHIICPWHGYEFDMQDRDASGQFQRSGCARRRSRSREVRSMLGPERRRRKNTATAGWNCGRARTVARLATNWSSNNEAGRVSDEAVAQI